VLVDCVLVVVCTLLAAQELSTALHRELIAGPRVRDRGLLLCGPLGGHLDHLLLLEAVAELFDLRDVAVQTRLRHIFILVEPVPV